MSHHQGKTRQDSQLKQRDAESRPYRCPPVRMTGVEQGRQKDQGQDGEQILHHQPAQRHVSGGGVQSAVVGQHTGKDHGAGHRNRHAEQRPGFPVPPEQMGYGRAQEHGRRYLDRCSRQGNPLHGQQILEMKMKPHPEHKQDNADFGVLRGRGRIGYKAGNMRPHADTRHQIAHQRGEAHFLSDETEDQGGRQTAGESQDNIQIVRHGRSS